MRGGDARSAEPTRFTDHGRTFRLEASEFGKAMFSWKAFLYYRWRGYLLAPTLKSTLRSIASIQAKRFEPEQSSLVGNAKGMLEETIAASWREVRQRLRLYDQAFASLTEQQSPDDFRAFLIRGSSQFIDLGNHIGRLEQVVGFWKEHFGGKRLAELPPDYVMGGMRELVQGLSVSRLASPTDVAGEADAA